MDSIEYKKDELHFSQVSVSKLLTEYPTPFYLYSEDQIIKQYQRFVEAAHKSLIKDHLVCFALKANPNPALISSLFKNGAGADTVSMGEIKRAIENGCDPMKIVFSGVGKTKKEIEYALSTSKTGIYSFNVESISEIEMINECAKTLDKIARIAFRVNPKVKAITHKHISTGFKTHKFGILKQDILDFESELTSYPHVKLVGLSVHIGSQLTELSATGKAIKEICEIAKALSTPLEFLDVGGGLGVDYYKDGRAADIQSYMQVVSDTLGDYTKELKIVFEPGRYISASCGIFLTKVIRTKNSEDCFFAIVDGGMNDFVRTSLYEAFHKIIPVKKSDQEEIKTEIVGPICETADSFATNYMMQPLAAEDHIAVLDVGAYGHSMSSNYNMRPRPNEIVIQADKSIKVFEY